MQCPDCQREWRLAETLPPSVIGAYLRLRCPHPPCVAQAIVFVPRMGMTPPHVVPHAMAHSMARRVALDRAIAKGWFVLAIIAVVGLVGFGAFLMLWQWLTPAGGVTPWYEYAGLFAVGGVPAALLIATGAWAIIGGSRQWLTQLSTPDIMFVKTPTTYRR